MKQSKYVIGITGGVGSGKSEVLRLLEQEHRAKIIIADQVAHELMEPGEKNYEGILDEFGRGILKQDGTIDRKQLGALVFQDGKKLKRLNEITHPNVDQTICQRIEEAMTEDVSMIVCEAALLIGAKYESMFDSLWYVFTKEEVRRKRLKESRGYTEQQMDSMLSKQKSEEEFKQAADVIIDNSGELECTRYQIQKIVDSIETL